MTTPLIGITTRPRTVPSTAGESAAHTLHRTYTDSIISAGGIPVLLAPVPADAVALLLDRVDAVVLTGGGDIDPARYGSKPDDTVYGVDAERDEFEIAVVAEAKRLRLPTLAICRGLQIVNVALGGTLIVDIPREFGSQHHAVTGPGVFEGGQKVTLDPGCRVARVIGRTELGVNSIHHQAVRTVAPGLRVVGTADDGIPEVLESDDEAWPLLAVQWHPEYLTAGADDASLALFSALVEQATRFATV